ncbi:hypothetical protein DAI22_02g341000 [Oryza sativa Japonica Group]|nr:hypothetical protein DAI22_02g341000 [Oryza sativa Japonica Group]
MYRLLRIIFHLRANHYCCVVSQNPKLSPIINKKTGCLFYHGHLNLHFRSLERLATM